MVVAYQKGLEAVAAALSGFGYQTVPFGQSGVPIDALIYTGQDGFAPISQLSSAGEDQIGRLGIFIVNVRGKSVAEIVEMLQRRMYSPLF